MDSSQLKIFNSLINNIEASFPTSSIYLDVSKGEIKDNNINDIDSLYFEVLEQLVYFENIGLDKQEALKILLNTEPYCNYNELKEKFNKELGVLV